MARPNLAKQRIGLINKNNFGSIMIIEKYNSVDDMFVRFIDTDNLVPCHWTHFIKGAVKNPFDKSVYGIGYIGDGKYKTEINGKGTKQYKTWNGMLQRCYSEKFQEKKPTYKGCSVTPEWRNFQNFAKWYEENYYGVEGEVMCLDKDILIKGNKIYSPDTCIFVPLKINSLFIKSDASRGNLPVGVTWDRRYKKYQSICMKKGKNVRVGYFESITDAFYAYKSLKEIVIKEVADDYKDKIPENLYNAMVNYKVEIRD